MTPESRVKKAIKTLLTEFAADHPVWWFMPVPGRLSRAGIPDFICCVNGKFLAIEAKAANGKTTTIQELTLQRITSAKGTAVVVTPSDLGNLRNLLEDLCV